MERHEFSQEIVAQKTAGYMPSRYGRMKWLKKDSWLVPDQRLIFCNKFFLIPVDGCEDAG